MRVEKPRGGAARFIKGVGHGPLDLLGIEQDRVRGGVHRAAVAGENLPEGGLVAAGHALDQPSIRCLWGLHVNANCTRSHTS